MSPLSTFYQIEIKTIELTGKWANINDDNIQLNIKRKEKATPFSTDTPKSITKDADTIRLTGKREEMEGKI